MYRETGLRKFYDLNDAVKKKNVTKIISAIERNGSRIKRFRRPEGSDVNKAQFKWSQQDRSDSLPASDPVLLITSVLLHFEY